MTREQILDEAARSKDLSRICKKIGGGLYDDLRQYVLESLCKMDEEKIKVLHEKKRLYYYAAGIAWKAFNLKNESFYRTYRMTYIDSNIDVEKVKLADEEDTQEPILVKLESEVSQLPWYDQELLKLYSLTPSVRKLSEKTSIPYKSIHNTVKKAKETIKNRFKE